MQKEAVVNKTSRLATDPQNGGGYILAGTWKIQ